MVFKNCFGMSGEAENRGKKTWSELRMLVRELRQQVAGLWYRTPYSFKFRKLPDGRTRIYFLNAPSPGRETTILYVDTTEDGLEAERRTLPLICLIDNQALPSMSRLSKEEQAMWDRRRVGVSGIASFDLHNESGRIIFSAPCAIFQCRDDSTTVSYHHPLQPFQLSLESHGAKLNPLMCPTNPDLIAYVCNNDLYVTCSWSGCDTRLTFTQDKRSCDSSVIAGVPSFVIQEEFDRFQGFWWQPAKKDNKYRILYEETDESSVNLISYGTSSSVNPARDYRFPRTGTLNARSYLRMMEFELNEEGGICNVVRLNLIASLCHCFPWYEYLLKADWMTDGSAIWVQLLDRDQRRLELILIPLDSFEECLNECSSPSDIEMNSNGTQSQFRVLYSELSDLWINEHRLLYFLRSGSENSNNISFLWASEESGWRHLYLITSSMDTSSSEDYLRPVVTQKTALTCGEWEVCNNDPWVDEQRGLVYFMALRETPLEQHLYAVSFTHPGDIRILSKPGFNHSISMSDDCRLFTTVYSNNTTQPACEIYRVEATNSSVGSIHVTPVTFIIAPSGQRHAFAPPEIFRYEEDSEEPLYGMYFLPMGYKPGVKYPTVLSIYGGPRAQLVSNAYKGSRHLRHHMLTALGYCVVCIDSRGSEGRGLKFESAVRAKMGQVEVAEQVKVLKWLAETTGLIDMNRVAVHGWSYGGYLSLMALAQFPEVFKVSVAAAAVVKWELYDTGYTERYMGLPCDNPGAYKAGNVLNYIRDLPDEENRLLLIHGVNDDNVHFAHACELIQALIRACKPYQLQIYPNERHNFRHLDATEHFETAFFSFLQNHL